MTEHQLHKKITKYIKSMKAAPAQKTPEWYALKSKTIGGSEIATVIGINPYKSVKSLIGEKLNLPECGFNGNLACRWGTLFEDVTKTFTQKVLQMNFPIVETGSVEGVVEGQRYSPDGLGVVKLKNDSNEFDYFIVLFEFKAPYRSIPDGKIPKHYRPQIQTGLLSIPMCELSIFVNNCYRKCSLNQLINEYNLITYDKEFHDGDKRKQTKLQVKNTRVYALGIVMFYQKISDFNEYKAHAEFEDDTATNFIWSADDVSTNSRSSIDDLPANPIDYSPYDDIIILNTGVNYINSGKNTIDLPSPVIDLPSNTIDFGLEPAEMIDRLFTLYDKKKISAYYSNIVINSDSVNSIEWLQQHSISLTPENLTINTIREKINATYMEFSKFCKDENNYPIGVLPWKLINCNILQDTSDENWLNTISEPVINTLNIINTLQNAEDTASAYYEMFPKSPDIFAADLTNVIDFESFLK